jgi:hypothetical protein
MTTTFLVLTNLLLNEINEPELTSANFTSAVAVQKYAQNYINKSIRDIIGKELEWPWNRATKTETLIPGTGIYSLQTSRSVDWDSFYLDPVEEVTNGEFTSNINSWTSINAGSGTAAYTSSNNGSARLTGDGTDIGGLTQSISTKVGRTYTILFNMYSNGVTVKIGTTSGGTEISSTSVSLDNAGEGEIETLSFIATAASTFISLTNTSTTAVDIDFIRISEAKSGKQLKYISYDEWREKYQWKDNDLTGTHFSYPHYVFKLAQDSYGISPVPNQGNWQVTYDYWTVPDDLSASTDTMIMPDHWKWLVVERAKMYSLDQLSDPAFYDRAEKQSDINILKMRIEEINRPDIMNAI